MKEQLEKLIRDLDGAIYNAGIEQAWMTQNKLVALKVRLKELAREN